MMGTNDAAEMLEAAKAECARLERENADLKTTLTELQPAEVLVEGSYFTHSDLPKALGNFMRASAEWAREAKSAWAERDRLAGVIERVGELCDRALAIKVLGSDDGQVAMAALAATIKREALDDAAPEPVAPHPDDEREALARWLHRRFGQNQQREWDALPDHLKTAWRDLAENAPRRTPETSVEAETNSMIDSELANGVLASHRNTPTETVSLAYHDQVVGEAQRQIHELEGRLAAAPRRQRPNGHTGMLTWWVGLSALTTISLVTHGTIRWFGARSGRGSR